MRAVSDRKEQRGVTSRSIRARPALVVIEVLARTLEEKLEERAIPHMPGYEERMERRPTQRAVLRYRAAVLDVTSKSL